MRELSVQSLTEFKNEIELLTSDTRLGLEECEGLLEQVKGMQLTVKERKEHIGTAELGEMELLLLFSECLLEIRTSALIEQKWMIDRYE